MLGKLWALLSFLTLLGITTSLSMSNRQKFLDLLDGMKRDDYKFADGKFNERNLKNLDILKFLLSVS